MVLKTEVSKIEESLINKLYTGVGVFLDICF